MNVNDTTERPLLTPTQVREMLGLRTQTSHTLRNLERRGLLKAIRLTARTIRYDPAEVERFVREARSR